jgi:hypothetical protein
LKPRRVPPLWDNLLDDKSVLGLHQKKTNLTQRRRTLDFRFEDSAIETSGMELQKNFSKVFSTKPFLKALMKPAKSLMLL